MKSKRVKYIAIGLVSAVVLLLIWDVAIEPRLVDCKEEIATVAIYQKNEKASASR